MDSISGIGVAICQQDGWGRGKRAAKYVRKLRFGGKFVSNIRVASVSSISVIRRDATSAMVFSTPGIDITAGQAEWVVRWRMARPRKRRCATVGDLPRADILVDHDTDGVLSQWITDLW